MKPGVKSELHALRSEKTVLMQEIMKLKEEQAATIQQMDAMNKRMQSAEQRQKQMITFLAKLLQNPEFLSRIKQMKVRKEITTTRVKRKFLKHQTPTSTISLEDNEEENAENIMTFADDSSESIVQAIVNREVPDGMLPSLVEKLVLQSDAQLFEDLDQSKSEDLTELYLGTSSRAATQEDISLTMGDVSLKGNSSASTEFLSYKGKEVMRYDWDIESGDLFPLQVPEEKIFEEAPPFRIVCETVKPTSSSPSVWDSLANVGESADAAQWDLDLQLMLEELNFDQSIMGDGDFPFQEGGNLSGNETK